MASASINVQPEELHLHVKKPATAMDSGPQARCRMCTANGKPRVDTRWICEQCPKSPGLCSRECFDTWHTNHGFEVLSASRRVTIQSGSAKPVHAGQQVARIHQPTVIQEHDREMLSAADWAETGTDAYPMHQASNQEKERPLFAMQRMQTKEGRAAYNLQSM